MTGAAGRLTTAAQAMLSMQAGVIPLQGISASDDGEDAFIERDMSSLIDVAMTHGINCPVVTTTRARAKKMIDNRFSMMDQD